MTRFFSGFIINDMGIMVLLVDIVKNTKKKSIIEAGAKTLISLTMGKLVDVFSIESGKALVIGLATAIRKEDDKFILRDALIAMIRLFSYNISHFSEMKKLIIDSGCLSNISITLLKLVSYH